ncbi:NAD(P)/FAD-dependent oxidoreductase [Persicobacter psychrovividus]|uniref:C-3',4' desaturase CrtD n=1 Tax=Persicobacter psychrovividus TaxID=387638 RepID=A0ABN6L5L4_9BACT|nr:C-3',4' desaturase CrtD [Persicobacter psychrovividus]
MVQEKGKIFTEVLVIGSGLGGLSSACLLANDGFKVRVVDQNWIPGGCTTSYWRKGFVFEAGATTLVGLDQGMPLQVLLKKIGLRLKTRKLDLPMQVVLADGRVIRKFQAIEEWITEAEKVFGVKGQRAFWEKCHALSQFVWDQSSEQITFPPEKIGDLKNMAFKFPLKETMKARYALKSVGDLLRQYGLADHQAFVAFINEQLLITAQNHAEEVNALFGAAALCYTNYENHYVDGGLINLVTPFVNFLEQKGGALDLRTKVVNIQKNGDYYDVFTTKGEYRCQFLISGIPLNNLYEMADRNLRKPIENRRLFSEDLNSAFQMGIGFRSAREFETLHFQIHLPKPLPHLNSKSIFISLSHGQDHSRSDQQGCRVMSVSTHLSDPEHNIIENTAEVENAIVNLLIEQGFFAKEDIVYQHSSTQKSWEKWTGRAYGFVGGYPQMMRIKPWAMNAARWDKDRAYLCGDTVYPGQGIPGVVLSGLIAHKKLMDDWASSREEA